MSQTPEPEIYSPEEHDSTDLKRKEYKRQYHIKNRDKIIEKVHKHYVRNRDKRLAYGKKWRDDNPEKMRLYRQKWKRKLRQETFDAYGGPICKCCGLNEFQFLSIDHINNNGKQHRQELGSRAGSDFYHWLRKNNFPPGFQVLCFNCNIAKAWYGLCPHQMPMTTYAPL